MEINMREEKQGKENIIGKEASGFVIYVQYQNEVSSLEFIFSYELESRVHACSLHIFLFNRIISGILSET